MTIRGEVVSITLLPGGMHVVKFDNCALVDGAAGESYSRPDMYLTVQAENDMYEIGKHYDITIGDVAVEDYPPEEPEE